ncbi:FAD-binding domain-containing protein [Dipodascopsis uninucleata]
MFKYLSQATTGICRIGMKSAMPRPALESKTLLRLAGKPRFQSTDRRNTGRRRESTENNRREAFKLLIIVAGSVAVGSAINQAINWDMMRRATDIVSGKGLEASTTSLESLETPIYADSHATAKAYAELKSLLGPDKASDSKDDIQMHADSAWISHHPEHNEKPGLIVYPSSTEEVSEIMKICHKYRVPIVPFSGGTSLEGHFIQTRNGITIDFKNMNQILKVHSDDLDVIVQPAVRWEALNEYLKQYSLFFPPDPGPGAEIGGMIGTGCSGTNAAHYGTIRDWVLSVKVVLADGTIITTRRRPRKSSAGYNLTNLFIGSEGTLGLVTEATLKLAVLPENTSVAVATFPTVSDATDAVQEIVRKGVNVAAVELLDKEMMKCINEMGETTRDWPEEHTLFFKFSGSKNSVKEQIANAKYITRSHKSGFFVFAKNEDECDELWEARKVALWSSLAKAGSDYTCWTTDVAVPVSSLSEIVSLTRQDLDKSDIFGTIVGHVGDGNFHVFVLYNDDNKSTAEQVVHRLVERAIEMDGTCTGEHGIGMVKRAYLESELGPETINTMRRLKMALDPLRILNADKVINMDPSVELKKLNGESSSVKRS